MSEQTRQQGTAIPAHSVDALLTMAARAPSVFNTQPWLFRVTRYKIELYADPNRRIRTDPGGREMLISCGAALFGLRLGIRSLGYTPLVRVLPDPDQPRILAQVRLGRRAPLTDPERAMIEALPHRHTHRGPFAPEPLPRRLLIGLQHDAVAEHAALALVDRPAEYSQLATLVSQATRSQAADEKARADARQWVRLPGSSARDGVPVTAIAPAGGHVPGRLVQRDVDLGRGIALLAPDGPPPAATAVLITPADTPADWVRAGQALHRILAHAASQWVFASLYSQPLESAGYRALIRSRLGLPGAPQLILQLGTAHSARSTARRPPAEIVAPPPRQRPARSGRAAFAPEPSGVG